MGAARRRWSTAQVPESEQFALWEHVVDEAFVAVGVARHDEGTFDSAVVADVVGPIEVCRITSPRQSVTRTAAQIRRHAGDVFFVNLPLSAGTFATQDGRTAHLNPGDFVVVDSTRPFELSFTAPFDQVSLRIPHDLLAPLVRDGGAGAMATAVRGDTGVGAVAAGAIRSLAQASGAVDAEAGRALTAHVAGLIALAVDDLVAPPPATPAQLLFQAALETIERHHHDPDLAPGHVAAALGISPRYLHKLFATHERSVARWLLTRRLEHCARDLTDPARAHWSISAIATEHGFRDASYFARAFKAHYGVQPRAVRAGISR